MHPDLTHHPAGYLALALFVLAYLLVMAEEPLRLRKSKPVLLAAGLIWMIIGVAYAGLGLSHEVTGAVRHNLLEFAELFLFLLAAMTFINTMEDRGVFEALRAWLVGRGFSLRQLFWITGALAFVISPVADNLTTALIMGAVVLAVGQGNRRFVVPACINIVVAANAGGAFSPFGDITTLMVWQKGNVGFTQFFALFLPSLVNWLVPAVLMSFTIGRERPEPMPDPPQMRSGGMVVVGLFLATIALTVALHSYLHLPPVVGMMMGLGVLKLYAYYQTVVFRRQDFALDEPEDVFAAPARADTAFLTPFDPFKQMERAEWDTLMFFYGVILCVGGLGTLGYLGLASHWLYIELGPTWANVLVGLLSAVVDNIPVMFAVLTMQPEMPTGQWLLVTLTAGVGGSLLSIGSAAGVALMGQARGIYTFMAHLRWAWAIALGYALSILVHLALNRQLF